MKPRKEKKVEYLELIYDLIFVYIVGRNNLLLHPEEGGFVTAGMFFSYLLCTLAVIQIWNFTTFYINLYGRNGGLYEKTPRRPEKIYSDPLRDRRELCSFDASFARADASQHRRNGDLCIRHLLHDLPAGQRRKYARKRKCRD